MHFIKIKKVSLPPTLTSLFIKQWILIFCSIRAFFLMHKYGKNENENPGFRSLLSTFSVADIDMFYMILTRFSLINFKIKRPNKWG